MQKTPKSSFKNSFSVYHQIESGYSHLRFVLHEARPFSSRPGDMQEMATLSWQANSESRTDWYGLSVEARFSSFDGKLSARAASLAKLLGKLNDTRHDPLAVMAKLESLGICRSVYDSRVSAQVPVEKLVPEDHVRFMDDWTSYGENRDHGCTVAAVCASAEDAQYALRKDWARQLADYPSESGARRFAAWVTAGCPVRRDHYAQAPVVVDVAGLMPVVEAIAA